MTNRIYSDCRRPTGSTAVAVLALAALWAMPAHAADSDTAQGAALARTYCARCHVIDSSGKAGWTNAPPFLALANRPGTSMASLQATIGRPHEKMVNLPRPPAESQQIASYILSLRRR